MNQFLTPTNILLIVIIIEIAYIGNKILDHLWGRWRLLWTYSQIKTWRIRAEWLI